MLIRARILELMLLLRLVSGGVTRGDGLQVLWSDFLGPIPLTGRNRYGRKYNWLTELIFTNGGAVWVIPQRIKNYDKTYSLFDALPQAILKDNF